MGLQRLKASSTKTSRQKSLLTQADTQSELQTDTDSQPETEAYEQSRRGNFKGLPHGLLTVLFFLDTETRERLQKHSIGKFTYAILIALLLLFLSPAVFLRQDTKPWLRVGGFSKINKAVSQDLAPRRWRLSDGTEVDVDNNRLCNGSRSDLEGAWRSKAEFDYDYHNATRFLDFIKKEVLVANPLGCLDCAQDAKDLRYVRTSTCMRPSTYDLARLSLESMDKLIFLGDSMLDQVYKGFRWLTKQLEPKYFAKMQTMLQSHIWLCVPENHEILHHAFVSLGIYSIDSRRRKRETLVLSFGLWYQFVHAKCVCKPERSLKHCYHEPADKVNHSTFELWHTCIMTPPTGRKYSWTRCANLRKEVCHIRKAYLALTNCDFMMDVFRLARYLGKNRAHLPQNIFWLETSPTHIGKDRRTAKDWRNTQVEGILAKYAPHVRFVRQFDMIAPRNDSHCIVPKQGEHGPPVYDPVHLCYHSGVFEEYVGNTLSAVLAHTLRQEDPLAMISQSALELRKT